MASIPYCVLTDHEAPKTGAYASTTSHLAPIKTQEVANWIVLIQFLSHSRGVGERDGDSGGILIQLIGSQ